MTASATHVDQEKLVPLLVGDPEAITRLIARVLRHAHEKAVRDAPSNARGVLYVAHCFADEVAALDPRFDRLRFIQEVTGRGS